MFDMRSYQSKRYQRFLKEGRCGHCGNPNSVNTQCAVCAEYQKNNRALREEYVREKILAHYGRVCVCCREDNPKFLTLDHINNDGAKEKVNGRRRTGYAFYITVVKNNFPSIYQLLCYNCNVGKHRNGGTCPHLDNRLLTNT